MQNFSIIVYKTGRLSPIECVRYQGQVAGGAEIELNCQHQVYGRYVQFIRRGGPMINTVALCEVAIKGQVFSSKSRNQGT